MDADELRDWVDYENKTYFKKLLRQLHDKRMVNLSKGGQEVEILPPGAKHVSELLAKLTVR